MLELKHVGWKLPGGEEILNDVSLTIADGKLTVITGPNGGGKTSLAKLIAGLVAPTSGSILLDGENITNWDITERAKHGVAYAFQQPVRFKGVTVRGLLELAHGGKLGEGELCELLGEVGLCAAEYADRDVDASLSGGESKRIEIASVLARRGARVLVFDEPEAGIDLWSFTSLISAFERLKEKHDEALLVISHQERILETADNIAVIANGRLRVSGTRDEVPPGLIGDERQGRCPLGKAETDAYSDGATTTATANGGTDNGAE